jgi:hypothetical protein
VPSPDQLKKDFVKAFGSIGYHRSRHDLWNDFLEMAFTAICKPTFPPGESADKLEARYMDVVRRNKAEDIRKMPELLGITALALQDGGVDFLGSVAGEIEVLNQQGGQFFTPYSLSRMMAEMQLGDASELIADKGFITLSEPACGAGGMVIAAADVLASQGHDIGQVLYVDATDISNTAFQMAYVQLSLRGVAATLHRGNTLSLEMFEHAHTPAFFPFYVTNAEKFREWQETAVVPVKAEPVRIGPTRPPPTPTEFKGQMNLFD